MPGDGNSDDWINKKSWDLIHIHVVDRWKAKSRKSPPRWRCKTSQVGMWSPARWWVHPTNVRVSYVTSYIPVRADLSWLKIDLETHPGRGSRNHARAASNITEKSMMCHKALTSCFFFSAYVLLVEKATLFDKAARSLLVIFELQGYCWPLKKKKQPWAILRPDKGNISLVFNFVWNLGN